MPQLLGTGQSWGPRVLRVMFGHSSTTERFPFNAPRPAASTSSSKIGLDMKRRNSLVVAGTLGLLAGVALPCTTTAQSKTRPAAATTARLDHRELAADQQVIHVLNRLAFGARPRDVQKVRAMGVD